MTFMAAAVAATAVAGIGSAVISSNASAKASQAQTDAANKGIGVQQDQFAALQKLLAPYSDAGTGALSAQQDMLGLHGNQAQQSSIDAIQNGSQFKALNAQGQDAILQNAAATGGLRGGNVQGALGQFSPQLLQSLIQQQYGNLGGMTSIGQNAAAMTGNAGMKSADSISTLLGNVGSAQAGGALGQANAANGGISSLLSALGMLKGASGGGNFGLPTTAYNF
jgi:hypothetical protein